MRNLVAGTAGHIDHGKTSLVRALTGIDPDRLAEEKRRGITIDLGFAHLQLTPTLRVGFVDVPGHEKFIKNMLAGVGGIDLLLFVVAADESVKPQTREHFEICRLLGIRHGLIVLTKCDAVHPDILDLVKLEMEEFTAGSFLEGAPMLPVSSKTGAGLPELKAAIAAAAESIAPKPGNGIPRLPIDRAFSLKGFGTVVTGTLLDGAIQPEAELQLYPTARTARVRGVQVFGKAASQAEAGQRTAVNLTGVEPADIHRGMVLSEPGRFRASRVVDCQLELLASAKPLKHRAPVHFHTGTAEIEAEVRLFEQQTSIQPGARGWVRLVLREPALLLRGDHFIIRKFSPVTTIGGGHIVDVSGHRYRKGSVAGERLQILDSGTGSERITLLVTESKEGVAVPALAAQLSLLPDTARTPISGLQLLRSEDWLISRASLNAYRAQFLAQISSFHTEHPMLPGIPKSSLAQPAVLLPELLRSTAEIIVEGDIVRLRAYKVTLQEDESAARQAIEEAFASAGLAVPALAEVLAQSGIEEKRARSVLQLLLREHRLIKLSADLVFHADALALLRTTLSSRKGTHLSVAAFKDIAGVSRKYAIPLLEYADRERWTKREGETRLVL
jgi:selenocysteine-specific elongation factor